MDALLQRAAMHALILEMRDLEEHLHRNTPPKPSGRFHKPKPVQAFAGHPPCIKRPTEVLAAIWLASHIATKPRKE